MRGSMWHAMGIYLLLGWKNGNSQSISVQAVLTLSTHMPSWFNDIVSVFGYARSSSPVRFSCSILRPLNKYRPVFGYFLVNIHKDDPRTHLLLGCLATEWYGMDMVHGMILIMSTKKNITYDDYSIHCGFPKPPICLWVYFVNPYGFTVKV